MNDTDLFQQRRHQKIEPLPTVKQYRWNNRVADKQSNHYKERSVTDARESSDSRISQDLSQSLSSVKKRMLCE